MKRTELHVDGMTCSHCKRNIENTLRKKDSIKDVEASVFHGRVTIIHDAPLALDEIEEDIVGLGYTVLRERKRQILGRIVLAVTLVMLSFLVLRYENRLSFEFIPHIRQSMGYGTLFFVGILTSLHCIAMCGGINMSQCSQFGATDPAKPSFLYNVGRVISYTMIGAVVGGIGTVFSFAAQSRGYAIIIISLLMMVMALKMMKLIQAERRSLKQIKLFNSVRRRFASKGPLFVGMANGFMPCGPLQSMQLYALGSGSALVGALSMFYFSLGTFPLMFGLGFVSTLVTAKRSKSIVKYSGVFIFLLAVSMFSRGASLAGIAIPIQSSGKVVSATQSEHEQRVEFDLNPNEYQPIKVVKGIPVRLIINASSETLNGCNNPLTIPSMNIEAALNPGINVIEFTPDQEGKMVYTCWMGMITSYIEVVEDH